MARIANYRVEHQTDGMIYLVDQGPHDKYLTITNAAEEVIAGLAPILRGRRVLYHDTEGVLMELTHDGSKFIGLIEPSDEALE
jgi:hypothetical protein